MAADNQIPVDITKSFPWKESFNSSYGTSMVCAIIFDGDIFIVLV